MSMNIHIAAEGEIIVPSGKVAKYYKSFPCWQTPTKDSKNIESSPDPIQAYKDWVMGFAKKYGGGDEEEGIFDLDIWDEETDYFKLVGTKTVNRYKDHVAELENFIKEETELGFKISVWTM
jgi:hypothetical protein